MISHCPKLTRPGNIFLGLLALALWLISPIDMSHAKTISSQVPEGFEELAKPREEFVDVYFDGVLVATTMVVIEADTLVFKTPNEIVDSLDSIADPDRLIDELEGKILEHNRDRICRDNEQNSECGFLSPDPVGVIYNASRLRVDLYITQDFLNLQDRELVALPDPETTLSIISGVSAFGSGSSQSQDEIFYFENETTVSVGKWRARSSLNYLSEAGIEVREALLERDTSRNRYFGGLVRDFRNELSPGRKAIGIGLQSQNDTLVDKERIIGTPITIFMREQGRVQVFLADRLLQAVSLRAGNHSLDTSTFPNGAYMLEIRIAESGSPARSELRYFSKDYELPLLGRPDYEIYIGLADSRRGSTERDPSNVLARVGGGLRLSERLSVSSSLEYYDSELFSAIGLVYLGSGHQLSANAVVGTDGSRTASFRASSLKAGRLHYNFDLRHFDAKGLSALDSRRFSVTEPTLSFADKYSQIAGNVSYSQGPVRLFAQGTYRKVRGDDEYNLGLRGAWNLYSKDRITLFANMEAAQTSTGKLLFAGLSLSFSGSRGGAQIESGVNLRSRGQSEVGSGLYSRAQLSSDMEIDNDSFLRTTSSIEKEGERQSLQGDLQIDLPEVGLTTSASKTSSNGPSNKQYSFGLRTTFIASPESVRLTRSMGVRSALQIEVVGGRAQDEFELFVDDRPRGRLLSGQTRFLELPAYKQYEIRLKPVLTGPLNINSPARNVTLLPGNAPLIRWEVSALSVVFARLVDQNGIGIAGASIRSRHSFADTDANGYFQIEASSGESLEISYKEGGVNQLGLPSFFGPEEFYELGELKVPEKASERAS